MQDNNNSDKGGHSDGEQEGGGNEFAPKWLPRWLFTLIGPLAMIMIVVGGCAAYYAYYYVSKDSVRAQFWVGFMFSFVALVVVAVQVVIYAQQAEFMRQQAKASSQLIELMVITECAYMRIGNWKPPRICDKGRLHIEARLRNSGRTIAWDVTSGCRLVKVGKQPPTELPLIPTGEKTWNTYGAIDSTESMAIQFKPLKVTEEQANAINQGEIDIFVDGVCRYSDSMGGRSYYTYGFTLNYKRNITPRYERHHRVKANPN
jgi:hypothetical protein